jgi:glucosamine--fructose-6-phosphate aminotransferase (isomerizing)
MEILGRNTYQEIISQPTIWGRTLINLSHMDVRGIPHGDAFDQSIFIGCGSTYYLSIWAARAIQALNGWRCHALPASELWLNQEQWLANVRKTLIVAISRSGTTSETVAALRGFNSRQSGSSIVVTCYPESELAGMTDHTIALPLAQEKSVAQTRSFSNMMLGLCFYAHGDIREDIPDALSSQAVQLLEQRTYLVSGLGKDKGIQRFFFLGSNSLYGLACEAMLKMKEMSLSYSEAYHIPTWPDVDGQSQQPRDWPARDTEHAV